MIDFIKIRDFHTKMMIYNYNCNKSSRKSKSGSPGHFEVFQWWNYNSSSWKKQRLRHYAPVSFLFFVVFTVLYVSFVVSRKCGPGEKSGEFCAGNFLLDSRDLTEKLSGAEIFSGRFNFQQNDSRLLEFIQESHLVPPSSLPYSLNNSGNDPAEFKGIVKFVRDILKNEEKPLFFVEAGAHDGEYMSNTLGLEKDYGWTGLLIEPDPIAFSRLKGKNRKAWLSNVCLSVTSQPEEIKFHLNKKYPVLARIPSDDNIYEWDESIIEEIEVPCFPFFSILSSLNVTKVDFFSLDIEGAELKVLKTIPFDSILIKVFVIEHMWLMEGRKALVKFMKSKGYIWIRRVLYGGHSDSIFVHSTLEHRIK